jgi:chemotaxis protein methyltransferase CheR
VTVDEYTTFCQGVRRLTGVDLSQYKRPQMERRIRSFADGQRARGLSDYLRVLERDPASLDRFLDRVTINVSELFRNPEQYRALREHVLPALPRAGKLRVWSAGCSYGAEAYTVACLAVDALPGTRVEIVGTDIDRRVVERAQHGVFSREDTRNVPAETLRRHFVEREGRFAASPELRRLCRFRTGDLLRDRYDTNLDLVLCRNVVIYFTEPVRDELHARLAGSLRTWGYLMIGSSERVATPAAIGLLPTHPFIYRKA